MPVTAWPRIGADPCQGAWKASTVPSDFTIQYPPVAGSITKPDGKTFTVTGVRPVSVPGPWIITKIA